MVVKIRVLLGIIVHIETQKVKVQRASQKNAKTLDSFATVPAPQRISDRASAPIDAGEKFGWVPVGSIRGTFLGVLFIRILLVGVLY